MKRESSRMVLLNFINTRLLDGGYHFQISTNQSNGKRIIPENLLQYEFWPRELINLRFFKKMCSSQKRKIQR